MSHRNPSTFAVLLATISAFIDENIHRPNGQKAKEAVEGVKATVVTFPEPAAPTNIPGQLELFEGATLVDIPVTVEAATARRDAEPNPRGIEDESSTSASV